MLNFNNATLRNIVVHNVGNRYLEEGYTLSKGVLKLEPGIIEELLLQYFLSPFKNPEFHNFTHETNIELNEVYTSVRDIFTAPGSLYIQSLNIAKALLNRFDP